MNQAERRIWLTNALLDERLDSRDFAVPADASEQRDLLRALMNVRQPEAIATEILDVQNAYLQQRLVERGGATDADTLPLHNRVAVWRGDITLLKADAIVNAANSQMLGCFVPGHRCIDNAIHTYAGMQLRLACADIMDRQGLEEPTARVKATPAFNLPSSYILHTVGPIAPNHKPGPREELLLRRCYTSCLEEATRRGFGTLAFCCISTGVFGYPQEAAARVAIDAVRHHLDHNDPSLKVIFNVFLASDESIYRDLLQTDR